MGGICNVAESKSIETHYAHVHVAAFVDFNNYGVSILRCATAFLSDYLPFSYSYTIQVHIPTNM